MAKENYKFFSHRDCEYFPCHKTNDPDNFNCLFCYCPLYALGEQCGGNFRYTEKGVKDCTNCLIPHQRQNYAYITGKFSDIMEVAKKKVETKTTAAVPETANTVIKERFLRGEAPMRKTKIVCTLGPAVDSDEKIRALMKEGMNVARMNFSHGTHEEQKTRLDRIKRIRKELHLPIAALLDTKGPEIRLQDFKEGFVMLDAGQEFVLYHKERMGDKGGASITYKELYQDIKPGDGILIDDGLIEMEVLQISGKDIVCKVKNGGRVSNHKGINVPGAQLNIPFISKKDREDILFGIEQEFDFIAASFTRTGDDIRELKKILMENGGENIGIIAKIENQQGIDNIDDILEVADGIMVARGDMGVEIPMEEVPVIQKELIQKVSRAGKHVITATQMLDSMMKNPRPTRAEVTDVANAIYQGTSAIMLSGETAAGQYPVEAVRTMARIALRTESDIDFDKEMRERGRLGDANITNAISHATCTTASDLKAKAIITVTKSGHTARMISKYHPGCPIISCTTEKSRCRQLNLSWGVDPLLFEEEYDAELLFQHAVNTAKASGRVEDGDLVVLTAGVPLGVSGNTNMMKACVVGKN